jgi:hypothetical protein
MRVFSAKTMFLGSVFSAGLVSLTGMGIDDQSPPPGTCETPHFVIQPEISVAASINDDSDRALVLAFNSTDGFADLSRVQLIPESGSPANVAIPAVAVPLGKPLTLSVPRALLRPKTDYLVMITIKDSALGLSCIIYREEVIGKINRRILSR